MHQQASISTTYVGIVDREMGPWKCVVISGCNVKKSPRRSEEGENLVETPHSG
jgi:hypothetical protein